MDVKKIIEEVEGKIEVLIIVKLLNVKRSNGISSNRTNVERADII